ncbi:MAG TPA: hypothetical protein VG097_08385 [Gemmata sp.]|jgi:hypothetical protein|nr:hypothetical protein [Gemmata sp.]
MRSQIIVAAIFSLMVSASTGCNGTSPPPVASAEPVEKPKSIEIKDFDGYWLLKSSTVASVHGNYPLNTKEGGELILRIRDGLAEMRKGEGPWLNYAKLSIGTEPQCLLSSIQDASGQKRVVQYRYKLEGNTLITVQDKMYPDMLPESFDMEAGVDRQRQTNTYVKTEQKEKVSVPK